MFGVGTSYGGLTDHGLIHTGQLCALVGGQLEGDGVSLVMHLAVMSGHSECQPE